MFYVTDAQKNRHNCINATYKRKFNHLCGYKYYNSKNFLLLKFFPLHQKIMIKLIRSTAFHNLNCNIYIKWASIACEFNLYVCIRLPFFLLIMLLYCKLICKKSTHVSLSFFYEHIFMQNRYRRTNLSDRESLIKIHVKCPKNNISKTHSFRDKC